MISETTAVTGSVVPILTDNPLCGVGPLYDVDNTLPYLVEDDPCAFDKEAPAPGQFDAARGAIQQCRADGVLHVGDRLGDRRL